MARDVTGDGTPLSDHPDEVLTPSIRGRVLLFLGKEALLARLTDSRPQKGKIVDRCFHLLRNRAYVATTTHTLAEVVGTVRSATTAEEAAQLIRDVQSSRIHVLYQNEEWTEMTQPNPESERFEIITDLYLDCPAVDFKFHEGDLVLTAATNDANRSIDVCVLTFDGAVAALADKINLPHQDEWVDSINIHVLPYSTSLRNDQKYGRV